MIVKSTDARHHLMTADGMRVNVKFANFTKGIDQPVGVCEPAPGDGSIPDATAAIKRETCEGGGQAAPASGDGSTAADKNETGEGGGQAAPASGDGTMPQATAAAGDVGQVASSADGTAQVPASGSVGPGKGSTKRNQGKPAQSGQGAPNADLPMTVVEERGPASSETKQTPKIV